MHCRCSSAKSRETADMTEYCARCRREAPPQDSDDFLYWEALGDGADVICPGCITGQEQQEMDKQAMS
jgi:hypothetical protein